MGQVAPLPCLQAGQGSVAEQGFRDSGNARFGFFQKPKSHKAGARASPCMCAKTVSRCVGLASHPSPGTLTHSTAAATAAGTPGGMRDHTPAPYFAHHAATGWHWRHHRHCRQLALLHSLLLLQALLQVSLLPPPLLLPHGLLAPPPLRLLLQHSLLPLPAGEAGLRAARPPRRLPPPSGHAGWCALPCRPNRWRTAAPCAPLLHAWLQRGAGRLGQQRWMLHAHCMGAVVAWAYEGHSFLVPPSCPPDSPWCHCRGCTLTAALRIRSIVRTKGLRGTSQETAAWVEGMGGLQRSSRPTNRGTAAGLMGQAPATQQAHQ